MRYYKEPRNSFHLEFGYYLYKVDEDDYTYMYDYKRNNWTVLAESVPYDRISDKIKRLVKVNQVQEITEEDCTKIITMTELIR